MLGLKSGMHHESSTTNSTRKEQLAILDKLDELFESEIDPVASLIEYYY